MTYYQWLWEQVADEELMGAYSCLVLRLYDKEYYYVHPMDRNRDLDGRELRKEYLKVAGEGDEIPVFESSASSVLEVLVAFTERIVYQTEGFVRNNSRKRWFWEMLRNLGLTKFVDSKFGLGVGNAEIDEILDRWMSGNINGDGVGGPFPVETKRTLVGECRDDFRKLDLYYQFIGYLQTKYCSNFCSSRS